MKSKKSKTILVIVAHPDDETLWAGGTILSHPSNKWFIISLCRASDIDRSARFYKTLKLLKSEGIMGDLDDGPDQKPLKEKELQECIQKLLPSTQFDLIITHNPKGEYTRHLRHEEVSKAVINLWNNGKITTNELWTFAYEDGNKAYFPRAIEKATVYETLPEQTWLKKYQIITETYGFEKDSWEAKTTPLAEAFWQYKDSHSAKKSIMKTEKELNIFSVPDLEVLKSMYYKSITYLTDKMSWEKEISLVADTFWQFRDHKKAKRTLHYFKNELRIVIKPGIKVLKTGYTISIGPFFKKDNWNIKTFSISQALWQLDQARLTKSTLTKMRNDLRIFHSPSIDNLKALYFKTSHYLEGSKEQDLQPNSI